MSGTSFPHQASALADDDIHDQIREKSIIISAAYLSMRVPADSTLRCERECDTSNKLCRGRRPRSPLSSPHSGDALSCLELLRPGVKIDARLSTFCADPSRNHTHTHIHIDPSDTVTGWTI